MKALLLSTLAFSASIVLSCNKTESLSHDHMDMYADFADSIGMALAADGEPLPDNGTLFTRAELSSKTIDGRPGRAPSSGISNSAKFLGTNPFNISGSFLGRTFLESSSNIQAPDQLVGHIYERRKIIGRPDRYRPFTSISLLRVTPKVALIDFEHATDRLETNSGAEISIPFFEVKSEKNSLFEMKLVDFMSCSVQGGSERSNYDSLKLATLARSLIQNEDPDVSIDDLFVLDHVTYTLATLERYTSVKTEAAGTYIILAGGAKYQQLANATRREVLISFTPVPIRQVLNQAGIAFPRPGR